CEAATTCGLLELALALAAEVDGHAVDVEQLRDALHCRLERVRDRELSRRLHDHLEQRSRALELEREQACPFAGAQRVCGANAERREARQLLGLGLLSCAMEQLEDAERRPAEGQGRRDSAVARKSCGVHADRPRLDERPLRNLTRSPEIGRGTDAP